MSHLSNLIFGDLKCRMFIPKALGGKVVGTKGNAISNLQIEMQTKLITALKPTDPETLWIAIVIVGAPDKVLNAYNAISSTVDGEVDDVILDFQVHRKLHSNLYNMKSGKMHTRHIYEISAESSCRILLPDHVITMDKYATSSIYATLEGSIENSYKCMDLMLNKRPPQQHNSVAPAQDNSLSGLLRAQTLSPSMTAAASAFGAKKTKSKHVTDGYGMMEPHNPFLFGLDDMVHNLTDSDRDDGGLGLGKGPREGQEYSLSFPLSLSSSAPPVNNVSNTSSLSALGGGHIAMSSRVVDSAVSAAPPVSPTTAIPAPAPPKVITKERITITEAQLSFIEEQHTIMSPQSAPTAAGGGRGPTAPKSVLLFPHLQKFFSVSHTRITPNAFTLRRVLTRDGASKQIPDSKPAEVAVDRGRRRRNDEEEEDSMSDSDDEGDDGVDEDEEEDEEEEEGVSTWKDAETQERKVDDIEQTSVTATITISALSTTEAKLCHQVLTAVLGGATLQSAMEALPLRKVIKAMVLAEKETRAPGSTVPAERIAAAPKPRSVRGRGGGRGDKETQRESVAPKDREREKPARGGRGGGRGGASRGPPAAAP